MNTAESKDTKRRKPVQLTIAQAAAAFGVSQVTVFSWKRGTPRREALPVTPESTTTNSPRFFASTLRRYADKYGLTFAREPEEVVAGWQYVKPGPKPKAKVADAVPARKASTKAVSSTSTPVPNSQGSRKKPRH